MILVLLTLGLALLVIAGAERGTGGGPFGTPRIARFREGARAAVSLQFDDCMESQLQNALPLLNERGLRATFYVVPGWESYQDRREEWEKVVPGAGHEVGNHTLTHRGARDSAEAANEIGACAEVLARSGEGRPRLRTFAQPGGVPWAVTPEELAPIFRRHLLLPAQGRVFFDEAETDPIDIVRRTLEEGSWTQLGFHGTGGEWLNTSVSTLTRLLDFVAEHRADLWCAPTIEVHKYVREREAAKPLLISDASRHAFSLRVDCDGSKLETFGHPIELLYDQPLTVDVSVPGNWLSFKANQGSSESYRSTEPSTDTRVARIEVLPNAGLVRVERS